MEIEQQIKRLIIEALEDLGIQESGRFVVEHPAEESRGDYSSNVALALYGKLKSTNSTQAKNPFELSQTIVKQIQKKKIKTLSKCEAVAPGFINFTLNEHFLLSELHQVFDKSEDYGRVDSETQTKTVVEYTDPNPFKEFHIGHLYSNIVGESLARIFEFVGKDVRRVCYQGDVGMHVAKSLFGLEYKLEQSNQNLSNLEKLPLKQRIEFLGQAYAYGAQEYKGNEEVKKEIQQINALVYVAAQRRLVEEERWTPQIDYTQIAEIDESRIERIYELFKVGRSWSLAYFEEIYRRLGTNPNGSEDSVFEEYYFESKVGEQGYEYVMQGLEKGVFEKGEGGAVIFPGDKYELHTRVFINAKGLPTYEAKDLGLAPTKYKDWEYDESVIVTGNEIDEYFKVVLKAMEMLEPAIREKTQHISHGMVKLPEGKMSSRTGNILRGEWLLDEAKESVLSILNDRDPSAVQPKGSNGSTSSVSKALVHKQDESSESLSAEVRETISEMVGQGAVKYALLRGDVGKDVVFDFEDSISFQGNSGPYIQYTFARALSVLRKGFGFASFGDRSADELGALLSAESELKAIDWPKTDIELNDEERAVLRWVYRFEEAVARAGEEFAPHVIAVFTYELAQRFNSFYNKHSILDAGDSKMFRLALVTASARVIKQGLWLLGIDAPVKM